MFVDWWGYSAFLTNRMLDKISKQHGPRRPKLGSWYLMGVSEDPAIRVLRRGAELQEVACLLEMDVVELEAAVQAKLEKVKRQCGYRCRDGVAVQPDALMRAVLGLAWRKLEKAAREGRL